MVHVERLITLLAGRRGRLRSFRRGAPRPARPPACLLAKGDEGEIRVAEVALQAREGNRVLAGAAEAWRLSPGPPTRILAGRFTAPASEISEERPAPLPRWRAGAFLGASRDGWVVGPAVALPPARLWGMQLELTLGAGVGPAGSAQAAASGIVRW